MWLTDLIARIRGPRPILIYGKNGCPYTTRARKDYTARGVRFKYIDVQKDPAALRKMQRLTDGFRMVPVIVENGKVTIGYGGT